MDCCYAGQRYVKGIPEIKELVQPPEGTFHDLFFFLSSRFDQPSLAGESNSLSLYTERFLKALSSHPDGSVRYQQLVDRIHECFGPSEQQPQFNIQGGVGHVFCDLNGQVRAALKCVEPPAAEPEEPEVQIDEAPVDLKTRVERDAQACIPVEEAEQVLVLLRSQVEDLGMEPLEPYYQVEIRFPDWTESDRLAGQVQIGKWFKRRPGFFGRAIEQDPPRPTIFSSDWLNPRRPFVTGFVTDARVPYDRLQITAAPKYPNLRQWEFAALVVWSVREVVVFIYSIPVAPSSWGEFETPEEAPWKQVALSRNSLNSLPSLVKGEIDVFTQRALADVKQIMGQ